MSVFAFGKAMYLFVVQASNGIVTPVKKSLSHVALVMILGILIKTTLSLHNDGSLRLLATWKVWLSVESFFLEAFGSCINCSQFYYHPGMFVSCAFLLYGPWYYSYL